MADITIRDVRKSYGGAQVIHGVDLEIRDGEFVVILGPSGCGKSTLLRMIAGLERISGGDVEIGGVRVNDLEPRERGCAMVFQNYALYPHMNVADNIGYALKVAGVPKAERMARIAAVADTLGLGEMLDRKPGQLSGGQRQRVAMGRAIIREPKVFLFDEPLSNLDAKLRVQMRVELRKLHRRLGATSVFVTHDQVEAMTLADRLVVMNGGRIEQAGRPNAIYDAPASVFVGGFIGSPPMSFLDGVMRDGRRVELPGGGALDVDAATFQTAPGDRVRVGLRAEAMQVAAERPPGRPTARVEFFEELGPGRLLHLDLAGAPLVALVGKTVDFPAGAEVGLTALAADVHLYDPASGRRLSSGRAAAAAAA